MALTNNYYFTCASQITNNFIIHSYVIQTPTVFLFTNIIPSFNCFEAEMLSCFTEGVVLNLF